MRLLYQRSSTRLALATTASLVIVAPTMAGAQITRQPTPVLQQPATQTLLKPGPAPTATAAATSPTTITLRWSRVPDATSYVVRRSVHGFGYREVGTVSDTVLVDGAIGPSTDYAYVVSAHFPAEKKLGPGASAPAAVKTPDGPAPRMVTVRATGRGKVSVSWAPVTGAAGYMVIRDRTPITSTPVYATSIRDSVGAGQHSYQVYALYTVPDFPAPGQSSVVESSLANLPRAVVTVPRWTGRYQITLNGFTVGRETYDDITSRDGKGDEVYATVSSQRYARDGTRIGQPDTVRTLVHGDVNGLPGRVQAGSLSDKGGIRAGDGVPFANAWALASGGPTNYRFPLLVDVAELMEGGERIVITPMLWEYDGPPDLITALSSAWTGFYGALASRMEAIPECQTTSSAMGALDVGLTSLIGGVQSVIGSAHDRPIGMTRTSSGLEYRIQPILLDFAAAEHLAAANPTGKGPGIIAIRYQEPLTTNLTQMGSALNGDYTLYLQIKRLQ